MPKMKTHPDLGGLFSAILVAAHNNPGHYRGFYGVGKIRAFYAVSRAADLRIGARYRFGFHTKPG